MIELIRIKINSFIQLMWEIILPLIVCNFIIYILGCFISWDLNIFHWWAINNTFGRVLISFIELIILVNIPKWLNEFKNK